MNPALKIVNLNMSDLMMISCIVMASQIQTMVLILPTPPQDALTIGNSSILMVPAYQAVLIHTEMNGRTDHTSVSPLVPMDTGAP